MSRHCKAPCFQSSKTWEAWRLLVLWRLGKRGGINQARFHDNNGSNTNSSSSSNSSGGSTNSDYKKNMIDTNGEELHIA